MNSRKKWWESRMFWVNLLSGAAVLTPEIRDLVPASAQPYCVASLTLINIVLRLLTNKPIG